MTETTTLTLGQQLKHARESLNISIEEAANQTNLKKAHIESLENDIFILANVPPTFVRGYVRNYVRFLRLPEELINSANYGEVTIPKQAKRPLKPIKVTRNHKSQTRWVKILTWLVLLAAIGMTLAWWWQDHQKSQENNKQLVSESVQLSKSSESNLSLQSTADTSDSNSIDLSDISSATTSDTNNTESQTSAISSVNTSISATSEDSTTVATAENQGQAVTSTSNSVSATTEDNSTTQANTGTVVTTTTEEATPVNILQQIAPVEEPKAEDATTTQDAVVNNDELRIEVTNGQSWLTVRGKNNKKLAEKLYNAGDILTFNDNENYRLTVGAPVNVKIYYKGQEVPMQLDGRVARFRLPLAN